MRLFRQSKGYDMAEKKNQKYRKNKRPISRNVYWTNKMKSSYQTKEEKDANEEVIENAAELGTESGILHRFSLIIWMWMNRQE